MIAKNIFLMALVAFVVYKITKKRIRRAASRNMFTVQGFHTPGYLQPGCAARVVYLQ